MKKKTNNTKKHALPRWPQKIVIGRTTDGEDSQRLVYWISDRPADGKSWREYVLVPLKKR